MRIEEPFQNPDIKSTVYLSRRNLLSLLVMLDRVKAGGDSKCKVVKWDTVHPKYPCSHVTRVIAVEDADYYADRAAGVIRDVDVDRLVPIPKTGLGPPTRERGKRCAT